MGFTRKLVTMKVYQYKDYQQYVDRQSIINKEKLYWTYVRRKTVKLICEDKKQANFIICHGTRSGAEQKFFKKFFPNAYIIGTEISDTAWQFPMTIQHDFTKIKEQWIDKADIIYSNSFDHTIDPITTIQTWRDQLNKSGRIYLEYSERQSIGNEDDPLDATNEEIEHLIINNNLDIISKITEDISHGGIVFVCEKK